MPTPSVRDWRPSTAGAWLLTVLAALLAIFVLLCAIYSFHLVNFDGLGKFGLVALIFAPQLLIVVIGALVLTVIAIRGRARLASYLLAIAVVLPALLWLWTTSAMRTYAKDHRVQLSLGAALLPKWNGGGPQLDKSVSYGTAPDGTNLLLDVWRTQHAKSGALHPAFIRLHGGGWVNGTRGEMAEWNAWLNELGYDVFDVEYRMPPPLHWLDEIGDVKCAVGWVAAHAADYRIDPARISVTGFSAGGNLALLAAYSMGDMQLPASCSVPDVKIRTVVNIYGPSDLALGFYESGSLNYTQTVMRRYLGGSPEEFPDRYKLLSPLTHVTETSAPTITFLGTSDRIVGTNQAKKLDAALAQVKVPHEMYLLPSQDHGFDANWSNFGSQFARAKVAAFLRQYDP